MASAIHALLTVKRHCGVLLLTWPLQQSEAIKIHDSGGRPFHSTKLDYEWASEPGGFRRGEDFISAGDIGLLRHRILRTMGTPSDVLVQMGVTPESVREHRDEILRAAWPELHPFPTGKPVQVSPAIERIVDYGQLAPTLLAFWTGNGFQGMSTHYALRIEIPGEPNIAVRSEGKVPWSLPLIFEAGERSWHNSDLSILRELARLVELEGPNSHETMGRRYWSEGFWSNRTLWKGLVGTDLDQVLTVERSSLLEGFSKAMRRFRIERASSGTINGEPEALQLDIVALAPGTLDGVRWWNLLEAGEPTSDWNQFIALFDTAEACMDRHGFLREWKQAGAERTLQIDAVGSIGFAERRLQSFVLVPWRDAGFGGKPEFEVLLRRKGDWCGTIWLSSQESGALITTMHSGKGDHWLDDEHVSFHPTRPTYGRVDDQGHFEVRLIEAPK
jgi:hypothetical protein